MENELNRSSDNDWLFITDRSNLITIYSSGVVELAHNEYQHRLDIRDEFNGRIPFFQGAIPDDAINCLKEAGKRIPVVLRFGAELSEQLSEKSESKMGQAFAISNFPVSLTLLKAVEFLSVEEQKDSLERLDMLNGREEKKVAQSVFSDFNPSISIKDFISENQHADVPVTKALDDVVGAIAGVLKVNVTDENELQVIGGIASDLVSIYHESQPDISWLESDKDSEEAALKSKFDNWLWPALVRQLLDMDSKDGFGGIAFLDQFINEKTDLPDELRPVAYTWRDVVKQVLDNEKDIPSLKTKGRPVQRGALLFLLRRTPDRLIEEGGEEIDCTVRAVAVAFAGSLSGFLGLDDKLRPEWSICMSIVDSLIENKRGVWNTSLVRFKLELIKRSDSRLSLQIGTHTLKSFERVPTDLNDYIYTVAEKAGYELEIDCTLWKRKFISKSRTKGKSFFLSRVKQKNSRFRPIRIEVICKDISAKTALKTLGIISLAKLLSTGGTTDGRCRYSISDSKNSIVAIKDQLPETMGIEEFFRHLYAIEVAVDDYSDIVRKPRRVRV